MANQYTKNPSTTYGAYHQRVRKVMGKASQYPCWWCGKADGAEWCQLHGLDGSHVLHFVPSCRPCHRFYDGTPAAVAKSNRARKGEKRSGYVVKDQESYSKAQSDRAAKFWADPANRARMRRAHQARNGWKMDGGDAR